MLINVIFEVKDKGELVEILQTGSKYSLLDYKVKTFELDQKIIKKMLKNKKEEIKCKQ